ncbi:hypothetical protein ASD48_21100 [Streptomyces sp. Root1310]|nr:hypothetical protein ASD48_21100 [Streptomyces sp. Root1310]
MIGARRFLGAVVVWSERVVVRDGVRLVCRDRGGLGQLVVLLQGLAGHAGEWEVVASRLIAGIGSSRSISGGTARASVIRRMSPWPQSGVTHQRVTCTAGGWDVDGAFRCSAVS